ncbi:Panacea domain-containing protein [Corticicoccus populi]|uniref:Panacea domain-containing protein n=1 Tax=Corticicoccus populi TaxID=1812821 RepID=A0ABW5WVH9_9STAP
MIKNEHFFNNIDDLIGYMKSRYQYISPLKLQKGLYFLFAYYTQLYGQKLQMASGLSEQDFSDYPKYLFGEDFEAWRYGPVIRDVYFKNRNGEYTDDFNEDIFEGDTGREIQLFIDDILDDLMRTSDFNLVDRSHEDESWITAYHSGGGTGTIPKEDIVKDYSKNS